MVLGKSSGLSSLFVSRMPLLLQMVQPLWELVPDLLPESQDSWEMFGISTHAAQCFMTVMCLCSEL